VRGLSCLCYFPVGGMLPQAPHHVN
jgi:hypothetical protein